MKILLSAASRDYDWVNESVMTFVQLSHSAPLNCVLKLDIADSTCIAWGRNQLRNKAVGFHADWLFMLDSDISAINPNLAQMIKTAHTHNADIVSGLYVSALNGKPSLSAYKLVNGVYNPEIVWPKEIAEYDAVGAGYMLISGKVFTALDKSPFDQFVGLGEDISFCNRARTAGFKIIVDPSIELQHKKAQNMTRETWEKSGKVL